MGSDSDPRSVDIAIAAGARLAGSVSGGVAERLDAGVRAALAEPADGGRDDLPSGATVHVTIVDAEEMRRLNRDYHATDASTDVLAFDLSDVNGPLVGDIYVCIDDARAAAANAACAVDEELVRLAVHGTLHLVGHDHPSGAERWDSAMFRIQEAIVARVSDSEASGGC